VAVDPLYRYLRPPPGATEKGIDATERKLGFRLDPSYRRFLAHADGWPGFFHNIDLFSTGQLVAGPGLDSVHTGLAAIGDEDFQTGIGFGLDEVFPIGKDMGQADMWLMVKPTCASAGQVIWYWGSEDERFPDFDEFFLSMLDYLRRDLQRAAGVT
jgi:hypothetical protein